MADAPTMATQAPVPVQQVPAPLQAAPTWHPDIQQHFQNAYNVHQPLVSQIQKGMPAGYPAGGGGQVTPPAESPPPFQDPSYPPLGPATYGSGQDPTYTDPNQSPNDWNAQSTSVRGVLLPQNVAPPDESYSHTIDTVAPNYTSDYVQNPVQSPQDSLNTFDAYFSGAGGDAGGGD